MVCETLERVCNFGATLNVLRAVVVDVRVDASSRAMGGLLRSPASSTQHTIRTFSLMLSLVFCCTTTMQVHAAVADVRNDGEFLEELGLNTPNIAKANISQEEYAEKMTLYLRTLDASATHGEDVPQLLTYNSENKSWRRRKDDALRLHFHVQPLADADVQSAEVRLLFPAHPRRNATHMRLYQVLSPRRRRLIAEKTVQLTHDQPKWADFDVANAFEEWLAGGRNLGLQLECDHCNVATIRPLRAALNALVQNGRSRRQKRSYFDTGRATDCDNINVNDPLHAHTAVGRKPKCCRHEMPVDFGKLNMASIIQPKRYEAGYCKGRCPQNFNFATNHSRIQNLVHSLDKRSTPRACCAPSKLEPLEVLMVDPHDASKLTVHRWDNMIVVECACS